MDVSRSDRAKSSSWSVEYEKVATMFSLVQQALDNDESNASLRILLAKGVHKIGGGNLVLEGEELSLSIFSAFFKRCALLWSSLLNESGPSQRLLLKLDYCQMFTMRIFEKAKLELKISMATRNVTANTFILEFCVTILQGNPNYC